MKTSDFILELIIAGLGTLVWITLLFLAAIDVDLADFAELFKSEHFLGIATLFAVLGAPFIYIIGIVTDRLVDNVFDSWFADRIAGNAFQGDREAYRLAVAQIYLGPEGMKEAFNYSRMRIRICRAWTYNSTMILMSLNILLLSRQAWFDQPGRLSIFFSLLFAISTVVSFQAWKSLVEKECFSVRVNGELLEKLAATRRKKNIHPGR